MKYDESVYTSTLDRSKFTKEQIERAERQAREIENEVSQDIVVRMDRNQACDRDLSEEELYGSVMKNNNPMNNMDQEANRFMNINNNNRDRDRDSPINNNNMNNSNRRQSNNSPLAGGHHQQTSGVGGGVGGGGGGWPRGTHLDSKNRTSYAGRAGTAGGYNNNANVRPSPVSYANKVKGNLEKNSPNNNNYRDDHSVCLLIPFVSGC